MSNMKFETISFLVGDRTCNAKCHFCVARMSPDFELKPKPSQINWRNFHKAAQLAKNANVSHVIITSYGEPTIFPEQITDYLKQLQHYAFPFIEMQTNGALFERKIEVYEKYLSTWYDLGLDLIALSVVHYEDDINKSCYFPQFKQYLDLKPLIQRLRHIGYTVKLNCTLVKNWIDSPKELQNMIDYSIHLEANQISFRPVTLPAGEIGPDIMNWIKERSLLPENMKQIEDYLSKEGTLLLTKPYGAKIFDVAGANVCLTNCLTMSHDPTQLRQLIFYPSGSLRYDWQYNAILLAGWDNNTPLTSLEKQS